MRASHIAFAIALATAAGAASFGEAQAQSTKTEKPAAAAGPRSEKAVSRTSDAAAFVGRAAAAGAFEIQSSQLAAERSENAEIKSFAQTMITDHQKADADLKAAAQQAGVEVGQPQLDRRQQEALKKLRSVIGPSFDRAYATAQVQAHREAIRLFSNYATTGSAEPLKQLASQTLPTLESHLAMAQKLTPQGRK